MEDVVNWTKNLVVAAAAAALGVSLLMPGPAVATAAPPMADLIRRAPVAALPVQPYGGNAERDLDAFLDITNAISPIGTLR